VGPIPEDWQVVPLKALASSIRNGFVGVSLDHQTEKPGVRYLQGFNIRPNSIDLTNETFVTEEFARKQSKARLVAGDILTVQSGHIGTTAMVTPELEGASCHALIITSLKRKSANPRFLVAYMNSALGQARMRGLHVGSSIIHINTSELAEYRVPLPPRNEQDKIAEILGTWDKALEKLDALIAAKERRKQALMQQLLTGERRLPQFGGSLRRLRLDEICERIDRKAPAGIERVLSITAGVGFQDQRDKFSRVIAGRNIENYLHLKRGDFSYNKGNSNLYPQGCIYRLEEYDEGAVPNVWVSFAIKSENVDSNFLKQYFLAGGHNHQLSRLINYGVRNDGLLNLTADNFLSIKIPVPPKEEQQRLGELFEGLASELAILSRQRAALDQQKRGLMQQLLTGQKRVTTTP
jgi:type I restriction enzyme S subunit